MAKLELDDAERWSLEQNFALSTDSAGDEVFVGLTREETLFLLGYRRTSRQLRAASKRPPPEDRERATQLREKHEHARLQIIGTMALKGSLGPTSH
jgi:hypothetical protein